MAHKYVIKKDDYIEVDIIDAEDHHTILYLEVDTGDLYSKASLLPISKLSHLELYNLYVNFDFDEHNPAKFGLVKNRLIDLGLLDEKKVNLNDFKLNFLDLDAEDGFEPTTLRL